MEIIIKSEERKTVQTLFDLTTLNPANVTIGLATVMPGQRLPEKGTTFHQEDEYSYIIKGDIFTCSDDKSCIVKQGSATFIPKGEKHWCRNDGKTPVEIIWVFVK
ncbi:MAG: cupin domain-containing protein [Culicoidibacterales bacterium]